MLRRLLRHSVKPNRIAQKQKETETMKAITQGGGQYAQFIALALQALHQTLTPPQEISGVPSPRAEDSMLRLLLTRSKL